MLVAEGRGPWSDQAGEVQGAIKLADEVAEEEQVPVGV